MTLARRFSKDEEIYDILSYMTPGKQNGKFKNRNGKKLKKVSCNLCHKEFAPVNRYERFCKDCKSDNELYRGDNTFV